MQKVKFKPKKKGRVGQFLRRFAEIVIAGGPHYIQPLCTVQLLGTSVQSNLVYVNLDNVKNLDYVNFFFWRDFLFSGKPGFLQTFFRPNLDYVKIFSLIDYFLLWFLVKNRRNWGWFDYQK